VAVIRAGSGERITSKLGSVTGGENGSSGATRPNLQRKISRNRGLPLSDRFTNRPPSFRTFHGQSAIGEMTTPLL